MIKKIRQVRQERFRQEKQQAVNYVAKKLRDEGLAAFLDESNLYHALAYRMLYYTMRRDSTAARRMVKSGGKITIPVVVTQSLVVVLTRRDWNGMADAADLEFLRHRAIVQSKIEEAARPLRKKANA